MINLWGVSVCPSALQVDQAMNHLIACSWYGLASMTAGAGVGIGAVRMGEAELVTTRVWD